MQNQPPNQAAIPLNPQPTPAAQLPFEGQAQPGTPEIPGSAVPTQVDRATFLAARLRELLAEAANLRDHNADLLSEVGSLRKENSNYKAGLAQAEINGLDEEYDVGKGTILQKRQDGTYWRIPREALKQLQQG